MWRERIEIANVHGWRIASIDHSREKGPWIWWWGPANGGYDDSLEYAGVYELEGLLSDPDYYGRRNNLCVPDYVARRLAGGRDRAKNLVRNWEALWIVALFRQAKPIWPAPYDPKPVNEEARRFNKKFPVGSLVRVVRDRAVDVVVRTPARNIDDRAVVQLAGFGLVWVSTCRDPATTCKVCGADLLEKWTLEWAAAGRGGYNPDEFADKKVGDCSSCPAQGVNVAPSTVDAAPSRVLPPMRGLADEGDGLPMEMQRQ